MIYTPDNVDELSDLATIAADMNYRLSELGLPELANLAQELEITLDEMAGEGETAIDDLNATEASLNRYLNGEGNYGRP